MVQQQLSPTWQLDMFPGGSDSAAFRSFLSEIAGNLRRLNESIDKAEAEAAVDLPGWAERIALTQWMKGALLEADSFIACLEAQDLNDAQAKALKGQFKQMNADLASALNRLDSGLMAMDEDNWQKLLALDETKGISFALQERRQLAAEKLPAEMEALINTLSVDGYHAWGDHYQTAVGRIAIEQTDEQGQSVRLSAGQAANRLQHPDRAVRSRLFQQWEEAWEEQADICAAALNHLGGFRLGVYDKRGWTSVLKEPLDMNRMSQQTLRSMWRVIEANKQPYVQYLRRKARLLGVEKLSWYDVEAPLGGGGSDSGGGGGGGTIGYDHAAELITKQFGTFSDDLAAFAAMAFERRWIEAEDREGKRPGGFCTSFPLSKETRIFMTYSGTPSGVSTLAHELGHAYHQHVMNDLPMLAQDYAMNVAETASTFAELIVADATLGQAVNDRERIALLDDKIQSSIAFYMNIHARFLFEQAFYEERRKGLVGAKRLNELMEAAQREAYCDELACYHPCFWASKLHFYLTDVPFYNFPYTFGYLFSAGLYATARREGASFEAKYVALLRDTASMRVEELAAKHLGVDLAGPDFWQAAIDMTTEDVSLFLRLTE